VPHKFRRAKGVVFHPEQTHLLVAIKPNACLLLATNHQWPISRNAKSPQLADQEADLEQPLLPLTLKANVDNLLPPRA
jgi:hypothetical protein